ncbi:hypothetical protein LT336_00647 [Spiroplasma sp. JKS002671]|nr:hypothetical protein [Spiroplasma sp. JKS002671]
MHFSSPWIWIKLGLTVGFMIIFAPLYSIMLWQYFHDKEKYKSKLKYMYNSMFILIFGIGMLWFI